MAQDWDSILIMHPTIVLRAADRRNMAIRVVGTQNEGGQHAGYDPNGNLGRILSEAYVKRNGALDGK